MVLNTKGKAGFKMFKRKDYSRMPEEKCPLIFRIVGMMETITKPLRQIYEEEVMYVRDERYFIINECNRIREAVGLESMTPEEEDNIPGLPKWPLFVRVVWAVQRITAPLTMPLKLWFEAELKRWRDDQAWRSYVWEEARMAARLKYETLREAEIKTESILSILEEYGPVPDGLRAKILSETDLGTLHEWIKIAARSESVEEFEKKIAA